MKALELLNYNALALTADDLKLGVGEALGFSTMDWAIRPRSSLPMCSRTPVFERIFRPSLIVSAGPVKLGITAVIDPETLEKLSDPDKEDTLADDQEPGCRLARPLGRPGVKK